MRRRPSSYHTLSCLPPLSRRSFSRMSTERLASTSWAELKLVMTRVGTPRQRSTAEDTAVKGRAHEAWPSREGLTRAGDGGKHPALAVLHRPGPGLGPPPEDGNAAAPPAGRDAVRVGLRPAAGQHAPVVVGVHLGDRRRRSVVCAGAEAPARLLTMAVTVLLM